MHSSALNACSWICCAILWPCLLLSFAASCCSTDRISGDSAPIASAQLNAALTATELPAPSALKRPSYVDSAYFNSGDQFGNTWPHWNIHESAGYTAVFTPGMTPVGPGVASAFGTYYFASLDEFDHQSTLHLTWDAAADYADCWVGMADFTLDTWRWYGVTDTDEVVFDPVACINVDHTYVVVLLTGSEPWRLSNIHLGSDQPPFITGVRPTAGIEGDSFDITVLMDSEPAGALTWNWQFTGGIDPGASSEASPTITLPGPGICEHCSVRVSNVYGESDHDFSISVSAADADFQTEFVVSLADIGGPTSIALERDGTPFPHITYADAEDSQLKHAYSRTWDWRSEMIDYAVQFDTTNSMLAADSAGNLHVAYSIGSDLKYAYTSQGIWHVTVVDDGEHPTLLNHFISPSLAVDSSDLPHVSYIRSAMEDDFHEETAEHRAFDGGAWSTTLREIVTSGGFMDVGTLSNFCPLALDVSDIASVVYHDYNTDELHYARRHPTWTDRLVENQNVIAALAMGLSLLDSEPRILYVVEFGELGSIRCARKVTDTWYISDLPDTGDAGPHISVAVASNGQPHLCYYEETGGTLEYMFYNGLIWRRFLVDDDDGLGDVGKYCDIALDADDDPHFSYYDETNEYIKYARLAE